MVPVYISSMDLVAFHRSWFGKSLDRTPEAFRASSRQIKLYNAFPDARGVSGKDFDEEMFLGTFVLTLAQTRPKSERRVFMITPRTHMNWIWKQMEKIVRYMVRCRRHDPEGIALVKDVTRQVFLCGTPFQMPGEPAYWSVFGFRKDETLPSWVQKALIDVPPSRWDRIGKSDGT